MDGKILQNLEESKGIRDQVPEIKEIADCLGIHYAALRKVTEAGINKEGHFKTLCLSRLLKNAHLRC